MTHKKGKSIVLTYNHANLNYFMCLFMKHKYNYPESRAFDKTADMSVKTKTLFWYTVYECPVNKQPKKSVGVPGRVKHHYISFSFVNKYYLLLLRLKTFLTT